MSKRALNLFCLTLISLVLLGCGGGDENGENGNRDAAGNNGGEGTEFTVYSGRSPSLVDPIIERFEQEHDVDVQVRSMDDSELLATLREEGSATPADAVWMNTAGMLGVAADAGWLTELPDDIVSMPGAFQPEHGQWVPVTARFRVLAYNANAIEAPDNLPESVLELASETQYEGRIGWTPQYSSFKDFVTALRLTHGRDTAAQWLTQMQALDPQEFPENTPMIQALANGEIDIALTNHYYVHRYNTSVSEESAQARVGIHHFEAGDPGNLALVTGAGVLEEGDNPELAQQFIKHLLSAESQRFAATSVHEYPVVADVTLPDHLTSMDTVLDLSPQIDFERLGEFSETNALLQEVGLQ